MPGMPPMEYVPRLGRDRKNVHSMSRGVVFLTEPAYTTLYMKQ
jgi:hypothetical protein